MFLIHCIFSVTADDLALRIARKNFEKKFVWGYREPSRVFTFRTWSIFEYFMGSLEVFAGNTSSGPEDLALVNLNIRDPCEWDLKYFDCSS
jgi:hypothetical protein